MFDIVLVEPEIPPNTGNVIRLAANTGCRLHLVEPLGFSLDDKQLKRAGLDYHELATRATCTRAGQPAAPRCAGRRMFAFTTRARAALHRRRATRADDVFVFGAETARPARRRSSSEFAPEMRLRLPMRPGNRSINLSNAVAVVVFEAWRQLGFEGSA